MAGRHLPIFLTSRGERLIFSPKVKLPVTLRRKLRGDLWGCQLLYPIYLQSQGRGGKLTERVLRDCWSDLCSFLLPPVMLSRQDLETREDAGYASLELPGDSILSLPTQDAETSDDLISPYASFSSTADRPVPLLSGWLDKLSPQG